MKSALRDTASTTATSVFALLLSTATAVLLARLLGPEERGNFAEFQAWTSLISALATGGLVQAVIFFGGRQPQRMRQLWTYSAWVVLALSSLTIPFFLISLAALGKSSSPPWIHGGYLALSVVPAAAWTNITSNSMRAIDRFSTWNLLRLTPISLWLLVVILMTATGSMAKGGDLALWFALVHWLLVAVILGIRNRVLPQGVPSEKAAFAPVLRYGWRNLGGVMSAALNSRLDIALLAIFVGKHPLGLYAVAVGYASVSLLPQLALASIVLPRAASRDRSASLVWGVALLSVVSGSTIALAMAMAAPVLVPLLFGTQFNSAVPLTIAMTFASTPQGLGIVLGEGLRGLGKPESSRLAELIGLALAMGALFVSVPLFGIWAGPIGSTVGYVTTASVMVNQLCKTTGEGLVEGLKLGRSESGRLLRQAAGRARSVL